MQSSRVIWISPRYCWPAQVLRNDAQAIKAAHELAQVARLQAAKRDQQRKLPWSEIEQFTRSGLGSICIPREYGGPQVSFVTLAEVFAIISAADPALGQIPQNQFGILNLVRWAAPLKRRKNSCSIACSTAGASATPGRNAAPKTPRTSRRASPPTAMVLSSAGRSSIPPRAVRALGCSQGAQ